MPHEYYTRKSLNPKFHNFGNVETPVQQVQVKHGNIDLKHQTKPKSVSIKTKAGPGIQEGRYVGGEVLEKSGAINGMLMQLGFSLVTTTKVENPVGTITRLE